MKSKVVCVKENEDEWLSNLNLCNFLSIPHTIPPDDKQCPMKTGSDHCINRSDRFSST
jgi:hypothetical protein